jgi:hypothetical protein
MNSKKITTTMAERANSTPTNGSFFGLLDLKKEAVLGLDGQTIILKTDDFVGVRNLDASYLHFVTVRSQPDATVAVGFFVTPTAEEKMFVRRYDPQTEEISSNPVDEATAKNLLHQVQNQQLPPSRVLVYSTIVLENQAQQWKEQTSYITSSKILQNRGISSGDKIVPGSYHPDEDETDLPPVSSSTCTSSTAISTDHKQPIVDGTSIHYPSIPVVDPTLSLWKNRHPGTKRYLAQLMPSERTGLFMESQITTRLLQDVLLNYYDNQWQNLLGDLQLAYILFLYLHCFASLEHWCVTRFAEETLKLGRLCTTITVFSSECMLCCFFL